MPSGACRLCGVQAELQLSHILPAFVFRWLKDTSGNGHIRGGEAPNLRIQDGPKRYWLCLACEGLLGRDETAFADQLFHPYSSGETSRFVYGEWLLPFCVSVSWRVLHLYRELTGLKNYTPEAIKTIDAAEARWKAFLLGQEPHPGSFEQHLLPFDGVKSMTSTSGVAPNLNRYLMRTTDMDLCRNEGLPIRTIFVYAKLGRFVMVGFIREDKRGWWKGTKVHLRTGVIEPRTYSLPRSIFEYMNGKAHRVAELLASISPRQSEKIDEAFRKNKERYMGSDEFQALQNDVSMFGEAAFTRRRTSGEGES